MAKNVQFFVVVLVVTGYVALLVPWVEAFDYLNNNISIPSSPNSNGDEDSTLIRPTNVSELVQDEVMFQYMRLAVQWPVTHCRTTTCKVTNLPQAFTIHGLWPDNRQGPFLSKCDPRVAYISITDPSLLEKMNDYWRDLERGMNSRFWKYEWDIHGTCAQIQYKPQDVYFNKAVTLHSQYNVISILKDAGITPGKSKTYGTSAIIQAIGDRTSKIPDISCRTISGQLALHEVYICFTPVGQIMDCPPGRVPRNSLCTTPTILFPDK